MVKGLLIITIKDNGIGLGEHWKKGFGLTKMSERVKTAKGEWVLSVYVQILEVAELNRAGHMANLDRPNQFNRIIAAF